MGEQVKITLNHANAEALLESLNHWLDALQCMEHHDGPEIRSAVEKEKEVIIAAIAALEAALKTFPQH